MNTTQALYVARKVLESIDSNPYLFDEKEIKETLGVTDAQILNALPIIKALEIVEGSRVWPH